MSDTSLDYVQNLKVLLNGQSLQNVSNPYVKQLAADAGKALGTSAGRLIAGDYAFQNVVSGTAGAQVGTTLKTTVSSNSLSTSLLQANAGGVAYIVDAFEHAFDTLGGKLTDASLTSLSAYSTALIGEAAHELHLGAFATSLLTKGNQSITAALKSFSGSTGDISISKALSNISFSDVTTYLADIAIKYIANEFVGSLITSAKSLVHIDSNLEGYFAQAGSIIGSAIGNSLLPGFGAVIGNVVGYFVGDFVFEALDFISFGAFSRLFGPSPPFGYNYIVFDKLTGMVVSDGFVEGKHLTADISQAVAKVSEAYVKLTNGFVAVTGAHVSDAAFQKAFTNPHGVFADHATIGFDKIGSDEAHRSLQVVVGDHHVVSTDADFLVRVASEYELRKLQFFGGGDLTQVRIIHEWQLLKNIPDGDALAILTANQQTAIDYRTYLDNPEAINLLISMAPSSTFALGWTTTLLRAAEHGLNKAYTTAADGAVGTEGNDKILTADGDDTISGNGGADTISTYGGSDLVRAGDGGDSVNAGQGNDVVFGDAGDDLVDAGGGNDTVSGGTGADTITDLAGSNYLRGDDGNDSIQGGLGFDDINGNQGNDTCVSGGGDDWVVGGKDNDSLVGSAGQNLVYGNLGNDTCDGGAGNDIVRGGQDNDVVRGAAGDDFVSGDRGDDTVSGGSGSDVFHSFVGAGLDRVLDFRRSEGDSVLLDHGSTYTVAQVGANTVITIGSAAMGDQVILVDVQMSSLTNGWITVA